MLWLPKWLRDDGPPAESEGVSRRTFLFLGAAAGVGLVLPAPPEVRLYWPSKSFRITSIGYPAFVPHQGAFIQAVHNEMESLIQDVRRFELDRVKMDMLFYKAGPPPVDLHALGRRQAARKRYLDWRANTRSDG